MGESMAGKEKKVLQINDEQKEKLYESILHVGGGFEKRLAAALPVSYQYTAPGQVYTYKNEVVAEPVEYAGLGLDLESIPTGMSKFKHWDNAREALQNGIINRIKADQGKNKTFLLFLRPRIEAVTLSRFAMRLEGIWVKEANVPPVQAPEELEDAFPFE